MYYANGKRPTRGKGYEVGLPTASRTTACYIGNNFDPDVSERRYCQGPSGPGRCASTAVFAQGNPIFVPYSSKLATRQGKQSSEIVSGKEKGCIKTEDAA